MILYLAASTYGQEFYIGFLSNLGDSSLVNLQLIIGTPDTSAEIKIEIDIGVVFEDTVISGNPLALFLDGEFRVASNEFTERHKGLRIYSTGGESIYILVKNSFTLINLGTYLAYPCQTFETESDKSEYNYFILSVESDVSFSQFLLVGCDNDTEMIIVPTEIVTIPEDPQNRLSMLATIESGATSRRFTLHKLQTLVVSSVGDLTGTRITSNKPLTVISGHVCANVPPSRPGCEPLSVQIPPTLTWGTEFLLSPFAGRRGAQTFKAVTSQVNTSFTSVCGTTSRETTEETSFRFNTDMFCYLKTSKPILLAQLSFGGSIDGIGDPAIALISPVDQYIRETEFFSLPTSEFSANYISISVAAENFLPERILLDGSEINCEWQEIYSNASTLDIAGYGCNTTVPGERDVHTRHTVTHSRPISVLAYGFNALPAQGYAYLTGQELKVSATETGILVFKLVM